MNLIKTTIVFGLILMTASASAQTPQPIYSFATELHPVSWYKEQAKIWNAEIKKDNNNSFAWLNYYRATRNIARLDTTDQRSWDARTEPERQIVEDMGKAVPASFEYNLCRWMVGGNDLQNLPYLKKALELDPDREEIISDMINWGETDRNLAMRDKYSKRWYESKLASPGLLNYNYNVIIGLKPNAILLTVGDNDTYPVWQLQSLGIRKDITVINLSLAGIDTYRDKIFKELKIPKWDTSLHSGKTIYDKNPNSAEEIKQIASNDSKFPVYLALTCGPEYTRSIEENLYLTGLSYEYCETPIDNIAILKKNFEQLFALDYIEHAFYKDISAYYTTCVNENYIVPMLKLYDHYKESGDLQKQEWIREKILILAPTSDDKEEILKHLKK